MSALSVIKTVYRAAVPPSIRASRPMIWLKTRFLRHDWVYDSEYYERSVEHTASRSASRMATTIRDDLQAGCVIDVGCGTGALLEALRERGCHVRGLERSDAALQYCRARRLEVEQFDLQRDVYNGSDRFDAAVSLEVAEHLPAAAADRYVDLLTRLSDVVVFTAAPPGQGGTHHVNEQPRSYWIEKFRERGYEYASERSERWRHAWKTGGDVERWYHENLMIFQRVP